MSCPIVASINLAALRHNISIVKKCAPQQKILAMIKSNAYGHSNVAMATAMADEVNAFGVARLDEALALRDARIYTPIVLMSTRLFTDELPVMAELNFELVVFHLDQVRILESTHLNKPLTVWLKVDSGMHRLGFRPENVPSVIERLKAIPYIRQPMNLMSHLSSADQLTSGITENQLEVFQPFAKNWDGPISMANSAAILRWPQAHYDWVRPGIMLYGVSPFPNRLGPDEDLQPVMTLRSELIAIEHLKRGDAVGYGATWHCPEDMSVGVVAAGYGDGYPRHALSGTPILVNGQETGIVGRVSMDTLSVDLRHFPHAKIGDPVVLWGEGLPAEIIANHCNTIAYELFCNVARRVRIKLIDEPRTTPDLT
jgi:alanine racemase